ncbi:hypothetical protein [Streptomyces sp. NPDC001020]
MTSPSWDRSRRVTAAASVLTVIVVVVGAVVLAIGVDVPKAWWPHTGQAFATDSRTRSVRQDPCERIWGPAKAYCERGTTTSQGTEGHGGAAWKLVPPAAGLAALVLWRRRSAAGQRRH